MRQDGILDVAVGLGARSKLWKNKKMTWAEFSDRLAEEHRTTETYKEFLAASKEEQSKIKDVGGYVGGYLRNGKRSPTNVVHRQIITLDIDFAHVDLWEDVCLQFDNAAILHGTHKHHETSPRYRLIMPLSREAAPDEYVAVARYIAGIIGIDLFDNTTFETNRLMFWPSNPKDVDYYFRKQEGPWLDVDAALATYVDWRDTSAWPTATRSFDELVDRTKKQEDPEDKKGVVGAFCRSYPIQEAIEVFLADEYSPAGDGRYTYSKGSTAGGLVIYEDKFAYSHHGTDPSGGRLTNAFDLVRLHKFGLLESAKSFKAMVELARKDKRVKAAIAGDTLADSKYDFAEGFTSEELDEENTEWVSELEIDPRGKYVSTAANVNLILANDIRLKGIFKFNEFDGKFYVFKNLPWRRVPRPEPVKNVDFSGVRNYIESIYGISGSQKIDDSLALEFQKQSFNPVKDYFNALTWDGEERVDTLLIDYFGATDSIYTREAIRKMLVGAVARVFRPGCKFDLVLTLVGAEGTGKSTFIKTLGIEWFSDTFMTVHGKEALEQIQGSWIIEMAELAGLRKAEVEAVKHFITKQEDTFRPAYGRTTETYKRQCVFFGTTNTKDFLRDPSGNRRFLPVDVVPAKVKKNVWEDLEEELGQIWAEAFELFKKGEPLYMSGEAARLAKDEQLRHSEVDDRRGLVEQYLDRPLPDNWEELDLFSRRLFLDEPARPGTHVREFVCVAEIWTECLGKNKEDMTRYNTRDLNDLLTGLAGWERSASTKNFPLYGKQKYYARIGEAT